MSADGHLDEVLSAYLDDEVTPDERAEVEAHVATCAECRSDLEAEREVRQMVRDLSAVDAPFGFYQRVLRDGPASEESPVKRRRIKFGLANIAATAAAWLLILGIANLNNRGSVDPAPAGYVAAHASVLGGLGGFGSQESQEKAKSYEVPDRLAGTYQLAEITEINGLRQFVYSDGQHTVSMFLQRGELDESALPSDAEQVQVNGEPAWRVPSSIGDVIFVQQPGVVVVIVGPQPDQAASDVAGSNGPRAGSESVLDHINDAGTGLLDTFGLRG